MQEVGSVGAIDQRTKERSGELSFVALSAQGKCVSSRIKYTFMHSEVCIYRSMGMDGRLR